VTEAGGDAALAGLGVGLRGEQVANAMGAGFAAAAASLVARRLGAGRPDDAQRSAVRAAILASVACGLWGAFLVVAADPLAGFFIEKGNFAARGHAADFYRIVAPCLLFQAWEGVLEGAFSGAGLTWPPMAVSASLTIIRIPIAKYVAFDLAWGVRGIWLVISVTAALRGVFIAIWFSRGTWKHRRV
jgi:Na+-driven multidrug efflux pump